MKNLVYSNGDQMPILGLGTWKSAPGDVYKAVKEAIKIGYRHIDCAAIYGNEKEVGQALSESLNEGVVKREELWITSKLWSNAHGKANVVPALKKTLADLQLEYVDMYEIHWPVALKTTVGGATKPEDFAKDQYPLSDTWKGMEEAVKLGLTRHIGVSNFSIKKLKDLMTSAEIKPEMNQVEINAYMQQDDLVDFCQANEIHLTAYAPLGSMDRPAELKGENEPMLLDDPVVSKIAEQKGASVAQILLAWTVQRNISVIPKSVNPARLKQNLEAADIELTAEEMEEIKSINRNRRYVDGAFWTMKGGPYTLANLWDE